MGENEWKISLGVDIDVSDLQSQINKAGDKVTPIPIKVEIENLNEIKKQLQNLGGTKGNSKVAIPINTASIEGALKEVSSSIKEIKTAIGTLDSKSGMKSLLSSINQISNALDKASDKFAELNGNLNALANKDFNINFGIKMGSSSSVARQGAYGSSARNEAIPQLDKQIQSLVDFYNEQYQRLDHTNKGIKYQQRNLNAFGVLTRLMSGTPLSKKYEDALYNEKTGILYGMQPDASLQRQMESRQKYLEIFKEAAAFKGYDFSSIVSQFDATADQIVQKTKDIQTGAKETKEQFEKLKSIFGGGIDSESLESIVADLKEIKNALTDLSADSPINQLKTSFDQLSQSLNEFLSNINVARSVLNDGLNTAASNGETERAVQSQEELAQTSVQTANAVVQNEERKQQAYQETADAAEQVAKIKIGDTELDALNLKDDIDDVDKLAAALSKLKNIQTNIKNIKVGEIDTSKGVQEIQTLERQLESLSAEYNETVAEINGMGGVSAAQLQSFENQINTTNLKIDQLKSKIEATKAKLAQEIKTNIGTTVAKDINKAHSDFDRLSNKSEKLRQGLQLLDNVKIDLDTAAEKNDIEGLIVANERYKQILKDVQAQLDINKRTEQDALNVAALQQAKSKLSLDMDNWLKENSAAAKDFGSKIKELQAQIKNCDKTSLTRLRAEFNNIKKEAQLAGKNTQTLGDKLKTQFSKYSSYLSVASMFSYAWQGMRDMFKQVVAIDTAMTELKKVTDETDASYNRFLSNAASRSKELGTTIEGLVSSTADFARLGYGFEESQGLAEVANIYAVVGDEIDGVQGATESLISTLAAFKDELSGVSDTDFAMDIVDKFNEVSNNFAISSGGIGEAMQRSASSLRAANNTIDESIALITAANTVVQDPTVIGRLMPI